MHPWVPCNKKHGGRTTGSTGITPAFPAQWFTAYIALSPVNGLSCHRRPQEALASHELDTSVAVSGPHDFAVRVGPRSSVVALASTASHRTFVTITIAPHLDETRGVKPLICPTCIEGIFLIFGLDFHFGKSEVICPTSRFGTVMPG